MDDVKNFTDSFSALAAFSKTSFFKINLLDMTGYANEEFYNTFGCPQETPLSEVFSNNINIHPVDQYNIRNFFSNARLGYEKSFKGFVRVRVAGRDIIWQWMQMNMVVNIFDPDNGIVELTGINHDITDMMDENQKAFAEINYVSDVFHSLNTIPWHFDFRTNVLVSNSSYVTSRYGRASAIVQRSFQELLDTILPEYRQIMEDAAERIHQGISTRESIQLQMRIGDTHIPTWVQIGIIAQEINENGMADTCAGSTTVIQKQKEAEQAMKDAQIKAEQASQIKTSFLANMSHEFRTPLNSILGFSTILAHSDELSERMQCLGAIQSSGKLLLQIIENVIEYSQIEAEEVVLNMESINISQIIEDVVNQMRPNRQEGVELIFKTSVPDMILRGDKKKIAIVVQHLLDNAEKYTTEGSITVSVDRDSEAVVISISDTGMGMTNDARLHLFDRFYKGDYYVPGTGLGLSIVKSLIEKWKGYIKVESTYGKGTTFYFTIPTQNRYW